MLFNLFDGNFYGTANPDLASDFGGSKKTDNFYRFNLNTNSSLTLLLNGLSADTGKGVVQKKSGT